MNTREEILSLLRSWQVPEGILNALNDSQKKLLMSYVAQLKGVSQEELPNRNRELRKVRQFAERHGAELRKCGVTKEAFQRTFIRSGKNAKDFLGQR